MKNIFFSCILLLGFVCGMSAQEDDGYLISEDDIISISVRNEPDFSVKERSVRMDGRISLAMLGEIHVSGKTTKQLEEEITKRLEFFVKDPVVTVFVDRVFSHWVTVAGKANRTGRFAIGSPSSNSPSTVLDILAIAGGPTETAKVKDIKIIRTVNGKQVQFPFNYKDALQGKNLYQNILLENRDLILVP